MCQQCDLRFDTKASRKRHKKSEGHKARTIVTETVVEANSLQYLSYYKDGKLLAVMQDTTIKPLTAPERFKLDGNENICKVSQGRVFLIKIGIGDCCTLTPDLVKSTF